MAGSTATSDASDAEGTSGTSGTSGSSGTSGTSGVAGTLAARVGSALPGEPILERRGVWLIVAILVIAWLARDVIGPFVVAGVIAYAFSPIVSAGTRQTGWHRGVIVAIGYAIALFLIAAAAVFFGQKLLRELADLSRGGPDAIAALLRQLAGGDTIDIAGQTISVQEIANQIEAAITRIVGSPGDAIHVASEIGTFLLHAFLTIVVTFYFLLDGPRMGGFALRLLRPEVRPRADALLGRIHEVLGTWLRGQLLLIVLVAAVAYLALGPILHIPNALAIGVLTGVLEIIPLVGPIIAGGIAGLAAFAHGGTGLAIVVIVIYVIIRQVEDQLVMPVVIGRAVHLHPVVTIFAVLAGLSAFGILGGLLGVPVAAALNVAFRELYPTEPTVGATTGEPTTAVEPPPEVSGAPPPEESRPAPPEVSGAPAAEAGSDVARPG
jgi:predicted PurR-regulated permease PerM